MKKKIALIGFSRLSLFPMLQNDTQGYKVGTRFALECAEEMTKEADTSEQKIYSDDTLYAEIKMWNGMKVTIGMVEMPLKMFQELGFGEYDETTNTLKWNPQGEYKEYGMTFRCLRLGGGHRMYRMFSFTINEIREGALKTKGDGVQVVDYQIIGTFTARKSDDLPGEIHDGVDKEWLDSMDAAGKPEEDESGESEAAGGAATPEGA